MHTCTHAYIHRCVCVLVVPSPLVQRLETGAQVHYPIAALPRRPKPGFDPPPLRQAASLQRHDLWLRLLICGRGRGAASERSMIRPPFFVTIRIRDTRSLLALPNNIDFQSLLPYRINRDAHWAAVCERHVACCMRMYEFYIHSHTSQCSILCYGTDPNGRQNLSLAPVCNLAASAPALASRSTQFRMRPKCCSLGCNSWTPQDVHDCRRGCCRSWQWLQMILYLVAVRHKCA